MSIFASIRSLSPFYEDEIKVIVKRIDGTRTFSLKACVLDEGLADPLDEGSAASEAAAKVVRFLRCDWIEKTPPKIGDSVTILRDRKTVKVYAVESHDPDEWVVKGRE